MLNYRTVNTGPAAVLSAPLKPSLTKYYACIRPPRQQSARLVPPRPYASSMSGCPGSQPPAAAAAGHPPTASATQPMPVSDTWLGRLFLRLLPGYLFYAPTFIMPAVTVAAAVGAVYGPLLLAAAASLPIIRSLTPIAAALTTLGTHPVWSTYSSIFLATLSVWYAFAVMPALDWLLGRELRNPSDLQAAEKSDSLYRAILYAFVPVHYAVVCTVCHLVCTHPAVSPLAFLGALLLLPCCSI